MSVIRRNPNFSAGISQFLLDQIVKGKAGEDVKRHYEAGNIEFIDMSFKVRYKLGAMAASANATVNIIDTTLARTEGRTDLHQGILPGKMPFAIGAIRLAYAETAGLPETGVYKSRKYAFNITPAAGEQPLLVPYLLQNSRFELWQGSRRLLNEQVETFFADTNQITEAGHLLDALTLDNPKLLMPDEALSGIIIPPLTGASLVADSCIELKVIGTAAQLRKTSAV
ncbi:hypothetical protein QQ054_38465 [Oscillatoria amoena NRMC-F 0135]|nr:hypothetical protein [Oscillatoria amoena NRMC-F 0135]